MTGALVTREPAPVISQQRCRDCLLTGARLGIKGFSH
jgi:hypothetical protein